MIPLIDPMMPEEKDVLVWLDGIHERGIWSNFGPVSDVAEAMVCQSTGGFPLLTSSGMTAIQAAIATTVGWSPFMTMGVSDYSHAGSLLPVLQAYATPLIIACDPHSRAMDLNVFDWLCREGTIHGAVITNPFGRGINRKEYSAIARRHGVSIVYDYCGAWGDFKIEDEFPTVFSFHATKSLPIGEGGCVVFQNRLDYERARSYINFGTGPDRRIHTRGINAKVSEITAAVLCAQLDPGQHKWIKKRLEHRALLQKTYSAELENDHPDRPLPLSISLCTVRLPGINLNEFEEKAVRRGFTSKQYYIPLRTMPAFDGIRYAGRAALELDNIVALPSDVSEAAALAICSEVREIIKSLQISA